MDRIKNPKVSPLEYRIRRIVALATLGTLAYFGLSLGDSRNKPSEHEKDRIAAVKAQISSLEPGEHTVRVQAEKNDSAYTIVRMVGKAAGHGSIDPRAEVDRIMQDEPLVQNGLEPGEIVVVDVNNL